MPSTSAAAVLLTIPTKLVDTPSGIFDARVIVPGRLVTPGGKVPVGDDSPGLADPVVERIPKRKKTSVQVTRIETTIRTMMIHVMPVGINQHGYDQKVHTVRSRTSHLCVCDAVGQHLGQVEKDLAALVHELHARFDLEVLSDGLVERMQRRLRVPEKARGVEHV